MLFVVGGERQRARGPLTKPDKNPHHPVACAKEELCENPRFSEVARKTSALYRLVSGGCRVSLQLIIAFLVPEGRRTLVGGMWCHKDLG